MKVKKSPVVEGERGDPPTLPGLVLLLRNLHRDHLLKGTGKVLCPFTGSRFNIPLTASLMVMDTVTSAALGRFKPEEVELSTDRAEKKKNSLKLKPFTGSSRHRCWQKQRVLPCINPSIKPLLSTPAKESTKAAPRTALPALQPGWRTEAAFMALSAWKALLEIGGCLLCWKELQVPGAGGAPDCHSAALDKAPHLPQPR